MSTSHYTLRTTQWAFATTSFSAVHSPFPSKTAALLTWPYIFLSSSSGDRSQIATIALAASKNPFGVVLGGLIGHAFCTGLAVIGGKMLAAKISERTVAIIGGVLFLIFGVTSLFFGPDDLTI